ncbi:MAG TPA: sigma-54 dependent transcriptional regulator [Terriglobales bacterium]|nr:sigma-54 dependent transcriptional regulator [Terriglobales bacterium]
MESEQRKLVSAVIIDDDPGILSVIEDALSEESLLISTVADPSKALEVIANKRPQIAIVDVKMPGMDGMELMTRIHELDPIIDVILITGYYSTESAVEAIKRGATDYLTKPISVERLREVIRKQVQIRDLRRQTMQLQSELLDAFNFEGMIGQSPSMLDVFSRVRRIAPHYRTVLVTGQTGTGKELIARALHKLSPVAAGPFVVSNCAAIVETLFESELFGHVRGAFTGATQDKMGHFEYANGGTIFLDEIGEMPLAMQSKLLRVLQNHQIQRVGSPLTRQIDVRVVAATNRDLRALVADRVFREDLYYRLSMVEIELPRLLDRKEDLPLLQRFFVAKFAKQYNRQIKGITRRAQDLMASYHWPGNVRELENVIGNACMMTQATFIDVHDLPSYLRSSRQSELVRSHEDMISLEEVKRRHILSILQQVNGDKARAAEILGMGRATLYNFLSTMKPESLADRKMRN